MSFSHSITGQERLHSVTAVSQSTETHQSVELVSEMRCQCSISFFTTFSLNEKHEALSLSPLTSLGSVLSDGLSLLLRQVEGPARVEGLQQEPDVFSSVDFQTLK